MGPQDAKMYIFGKQDMISMKAYVSVAVKLTEKYDLQNHFPAENSMFSFTIYQTRLVKSWQKEPKHFTE